MEISHPLYELPNYSRSASRTTLVLLALGLLLAFAAADSWATQFLVRRWEAHPTFGTPLLPRSLALGILALATVLAFLTDGIRKRGRSPLLAFLAAPLLFLPVLLQPLYPPAPLYSWARSIGPRSALQADLAAACRLRWELFALFGAGPLVVVTARLWSERSRGHTHGSSRWATPQEVREAELLRPYRKEQPSLRLGHDLHSGAPLRDSVDSHVLLFAPSGSGKTTTYIVPNLLEWPESALILDPKGELWRLTATYRRERLGQLVLRFTPTSLDGSGARYNPMDAIPEWPLDVQAARDLATILVNPQGRPDQEGDPFWRNSAQKLLTALALHVVYAERDPARRNLTTVAHLLTDPADAEGFSSALERILATKHDPDFRFKWRTPAGVLTPTHPVVASEIQQIRSLDHRTASGIVATALAHLELFLDPVIAANTSATDVSAADLRWHKQPVSLYLTIPPGDTARLLVLLRIIINQLIRQMTRTLDFEPTAANRRPLLLLLDEFPLLGKLDVLQTTVAVMRSYGIRGLFAVQTLSQLYQIYGTNESFSANCSRQIALAPNDHRTAELLSKMLGNQTVSWDRLTVSSGGPGRVSSNPADVGRPLLTPDELRRLPKNRALLLCAGMPPILASRIPYFEDPELVSRILLPAPEASDRLPQRSY